MHLFAFGLNHQSAPLSVREQVVFHVDDMRRALRDLVDHHPVKEAAIVSTCNRTEVYCNTTQPEHAIAWMAAYHRLKSQHLEPYLYTLSNERAVKHAFRVASGLDSMVLGEPQILGQIKQAVRSAEQAGTLGLLLHKLFQRTFSVAKQVRTHTEIGVNSVSMASAALCLAQRIYPSIAGQRILFVGAGEMVDLCATRFACFSPKYMTFANRSLERAQDLAQRFNSKAISLDDLPEYLSLHDIIVTCTNSSLPLIGKGLIERAIKARKHRPLLIIDLAVPRDVESEVGNLNDVFLYTVDDLGKIAQDGMELRLNAVKEAEAIIDTGVARFVHWVEGRESVPMIRAMRDHAERSRRYEVEHALRLLAKGEDPRRVIDVLSKTLTNKFLHIPTDALTNAVPEDRDQLTRFLQRLYRIHDTQ